MTDCERSLSTPSNIHNSVINNNAFQNSRLSRPLNEYGRTTSSHNTIDCDFLSRTISMQSALHAFIFMHVECVWIVDRGRRIAQIHIVVNRNEKIVWKNFCSHSQKCFITIPLPTDLNAGH